MRGPKSIVAQFMNWRVAEEVSNNPSEFSSKGECSSELDVLKGAHGTEERCIKILSRVHH